MVKHSLSLQPENLSSNLCAFALSGQFLKVPGLVYQQVCLLPYERAVLATALEEVLRGTDNLMGRGLLWQIFQAGEEWVYPLRFPNHENEGIAQSVCFRAIRNVLLPK